MRASRLISSSHEDLAGDLGDATELLRLRASPNLLMNGTLRRWIPAKGSPPDQLGVVWSIDRASRSGPDVHPVAQNRSYSLRCIETVTVDEA